MTEKCACEKLKLFCAMAKRKTLSYQEKVKALEVVTLSGRQSRITDFFFKAALSAFVLRTFCMTVTVLNFIQHST